MLFHQKYHCARVYLLELSSLEQKPLMEQATNGRNRLLNKCNDTLQVVFGKQENYKETLQAGLDYSLS